MIDIFDEGIPLRTESAQQGMQPIAAFGGAGDQPRLLVDPFPQLPVGGVRLEKRPRNCS